MEYLELAKLILLTGAGAGAISALLKFVKEYLILEKKRKIEVDKIKYKQKLEIEKLQTEENKVTLTISNSKLACFHPNMKVSLNELNEQQQIDKLKIGDDILSYNLTNNKLENCMITEIIRDKISSYYIINEILYISANHLIKSENDFIPISKLSINDKIFSQDLKYEKVKSIKFVEDEIEVYNLITDKNSSFFVENYCVSDYETKKSNDINIQTIKSLLLNNNDEMTKSIKSINSQNNVKEEDDRLLANYYQQVLKQSNSSFWFSLIFAAIGFGIIVLAIAMSSVMKFESTIISLIAGIVINAVSTLFIIQANNARKSLNTFHENLRKDNNISIAKKLCDEIETPTLKDKLKSEIAILLIKNTKSNNTMSTILSEEINETAKKVKNNKISKW